MGYQRRDSLKIATEIFIRIYMYLDRERERR